MKHHETVLKNTQNTEHTHIVRKNKMILHNIIISFVSEVKAKLCPIMNIDIYIVLFSILLTSSIIPSIIAFRFPSSVGITIKEKMIQRFTQNSKRSSSISDDINTTSNPNNGHNKFNDDEKLVSRLYKFWIDLSDFGIFSTTTKQKPVDEYVNNILITAPSSSSSSSSITQEEIEDELITQDFEEKDTELDTSSRLDVNSNSSSSRSLVTHFCFIVHGLNSKPSDLSYLQSAIANEAKKVLVHDHSSHDHSTTTGINDNVKDENLASSSIYTKPQDIQHQILIHNCKCNESRTGDGVEKGGERLLNEILEVIRCQVEKDSRNYNNKHDDDVIDVTISLVGNSLGGLYSRYAIAKLSQLAKSQQGTRTKVFKDDEHRCCEDSALIIDGKIRIHCNIFCTTASPHLGCSGHTFLSLPRPLEISLANILGQTLQDLFRCNGLIKMMCTNETFLQPLGSFRKRIAYANAYLTDFVVGTETAAFLHERSMYPHHYGLNFTDSHQYVVATLHTSPLSACMNASYVQDDVDEWEYNKLTESTLNDDLLQMSNSLDQLGWKKVFVDVRNEIPVSVRIPRPILKRWNSSSIPSFSETSQSMPLESRHVAKTFSIPDDSLHLPIGHNLMVALDRGTRSTSINKGGRPIMDGLAKELVHEMLTWEHTSQLSEKLN